MGRLGSEKRFEVVGDEREGERRREWKLGRGVENIKIIIDQRSGMWTLLLMVDG